MSAVRRLLLSALILFISLLYPHNKAWADFSPQKNLNADILFDLVQTHRTTLALPNFEKDERLCSLAEERSREVYSEIFVSGPMHKGLYNRKLNFWVTENIISIRTEEQAFNWWMNSYIHRKQIQGNFKYACLACAEQSCALLFTNYQSKT